MYRMGQHVWIVSSKKLDGRYNDGVVAGIEQSYNKLGFLTKHQFFKDLVLSKYKVAYVDCVTEKACNEWFSYDEVSHINPKNRERRG